MMITSFSLESMANLDLEAGTQLVDSRSCFSFQCQWRQRIILKMALQVSRNVMMVFTSRELEMREPCRLEHSHQQNGPAGLTGTEHRHINNMIIKTTITLLNNSTQKKTKSKGTSVGFAMIVQIQSVPSVK